MATSNREARLSTVAHPRCFREIFLGVALCEVAEPPLSSLRCLGYQLASRSSDSSSCLHPLSVNVVVSSIYICTQLAMRPGLHGGDPPSRSTELKASSTVGQGQVRYSHAATLSLISVPRLRGVIILLRLESDGTLSNQRCEGRVNL